MDHQLNTYSGDLFEGVDGIQYDHILFNPPFHLQEPRNNKETAYFGGSDGTVIKRFLEVLKDNLQVGQLSKAIVTTEGIHSIMLCEEAKTLDIDEIRKNIQQKLRIEKINSAASLLLNSIRQRALIEINLI